MTLDLFIKKKKEIDSELAKLEENFQGVVCGVTPTSQPTKCDLAATLPAEDLKTYLSKTPTPLIVDVREPQEFTLFKDWSAAGLNEAPRNVPMSRFVNFMGELAANPQQEVLLICKTGTRSLQAAKSLRRLGFPRVWNLGGGISNALNLCQN